MVIKSYWCGNCGKEEFPGKWWEDVLLVWSKMRVCSQEQNAQVSGNQGLLSTIAMTGQRHLRGPNRRSKSFAGFEISSFASLTMSRIAMEGGGHSAPIKRPPQFLRKSSNNHASATSSIREENFGTDRTWMGWFKNPILIANSQILLDLVWALLH